MHLLDSVFIFVLALVLFGPKKLPEIARQMGKLLAEFRRASNDFKMQMDEELRSMEQQQQQEQQDRQKQLAEAGTPSQVPSPDGGSMLTIMPPSTGEQVPIAAPYAEAMAAEEAAATEGAVLENGELEAEGFEEHSIGHNTETANDAQPDARTESEQAPIAAPYAEGMAAEVAAATGGAVLENGELEAADFEEHSIGHNPETANGVQPDALPESEQAPIHHG